MPKPTTNACIKKAEEQLGRKFPRNLCERLLKDNGGSIEVLGDGLDKEWIVFGVADPKQTLHTDIVQATKLLREEHEWDVPENAIAVGASESGWDLLLLPGRDQPQAFNPKTRQSVPVATNWAE